MILSKCSQILEMLFFSQFAVCSQMASLFFYMKHVSASTIACMLRCVRQDMGVIWRGSAIVEQLVPLLRGFLTPFIWNSWLFNW